ncbi:[Fe-Fe] hydrogenase large subunit C-terminal domain-containing protein [Leadbettera azotonutricia]|uniref:Ferredoxin 2 n=1 Tax=Leadbettera azotonutricia (strain ATCC BAA-888 / DSM 13862 / ZAS-9) TaxID=545695 RepID=F5YAK7_LEAAZ|nr:[Fe-Fe] hydrogenase large subunit C-terminal domain-containing protein [Leadbettera azotonutricia]AEF81743.1 ferredoxin 2 [Leadbettera azotonutricia ZAS-9]AEL20816.1 HydA4 [Leadbettera azotonutricia ZAS-9]
MTEYLNLKAADCKNCYKCIRHCPVKAIQFTGNSAQIIPEECILCGRCFVVCPQNAKEIRNDVSIAEALIGSGAPVYASLAPSFAANYTDESSHALSIEQMETALKELGFAGAEETALGAAIIKRQYDEMVKREDKNIVISTCCHSVNLLVQKYYPEALPYIAPLLSPMQAHSVDLKRRYPGAKTIFIGPCISKKDEADRYGGIVDCVLTFAELSQWFKQKRIDIGKCAPRNTESPVTHTLTRLFPVTGGILRTMAKENPQYTYLAIDGVTNIQRALEDIIKGKLDKCFIEMSACTGSCIGGPSMQNVAATNGIQRNTAPVRDYIAINAYAGSEDDPVFAYDTKTLSKSFPSLAVRKVHLGQNAIDEVLRKIGKTKPEHELNCGCCGYNTCRDKALAVLEGKANLTMCLPYLIEKANSFSDDIIKNTPNAIIVLNESFEVQQINNAACKMLHINEHDILGDQVVRLLDPIPFIEVKDEEENRYNQRTYLADYKKHVEQTIIYDKSYHIIICIMRDITEAADKKEEKTRFNQETIAIADKVIEKQMRTVQEIASLLGETTAETKIALTKLKEGLSGE